MKMKKSTNPYQSSVYQTWTIRLFSVGTASVLLASGVFALVSPVTRVGAQETPVAETVMSMEVPMKASMMDATTVNPTAKTPEVVPALEVAPASDAIMMDMITTVDQVKDALANNIQEQTEVPASYLKAAQVPGPFTAGVNQVIPFEAFGGDGMLTRLLLKAANGAPWSDNGTAMNAALLPVDNLSKGSYFYQVALDGNAAGLEDQALLDQLRANGTHTYQATVTVYGAKDGMADVMNVIGQKMVNVTVHQEMDMMGQDKNAMSMKDKMDQDSMQTMTGQDGMMSEGKDMMTKPMSMDSHKKATKALPSTGEESHSIVTLIGIILAATIAGVSFLKFTSKKDA
ncbi:LPXTG cell wall anchor domain-containing protein [Streptococcus sp. X16XC17]|uniref:SSURE domain-containing protein n=1 Tax=Streptococcus sp. X16XC17 TaxID=2316646 RepID=UPI00069E7D2D|nr:MULTISPECIES: fibronectin-binding SSURE repeat-containing protein [unclassified Streptococcus]TCD46678.1 LPXTG cell wall anchor domain-containing protein [Streptococcus sp. X16XC17]